MNRSYNPILFPGNITKSSIIEVAKNLIDDYIDNGLDPLKLADSLSKAEFFIKEVRADKRYIDYVIEEIEKRGERNRVSLDNGTKIDKAETGVDYQYETCGDRVWVKLMEEKTRIAKELKEREDFLKTINSAGFPTFDEETGEAYKIYPPAKTSKTSFKVTLPSK